MMSEYYSVCHTVCSESSKCDCFSKQIWIKDDNSKNCIAATVKCNLKSICVGIGTRTKGINICSCGSGN